jgi:STE24 endopeptidase
MFSDRLLAELSPEEVEAVFGHEVGHVRHHHMLLYLFFLLGSMGVLGVVLAPYEKQLEGWFSLRGRHDLAVLPALASLGAYIFLVFGFLSRRCERQADVHGCRAVSCGQPGCTGHLPDQALPDGPRELCPAGILTFIQALEKVAFLNGINREKPGFLQSWQHSTVARRVQFLQAVLRDPAEERRFQRRILMVKCALFAALGVLLGWQFVS